MFHLFIKCICYSCIKFCKNRTNICRVKKKNIKKMPIFTLSFFLLTKKVFIQIALNFEENCKNTCKSLHKKCSYVQKNLVCEVHAISLACWQALSVRHSFLQSLLKLSSYFLLHSFSMIICCVSIMHIFVHTYKTDTVFPELRSSLNMFDTVCF